MKSLRDEKDTNEIAVCPECDSHKIRLHGGGMSKIADSKFRCADCTHEFDEAVYRTMKAGARKAARGPARTLEEMDPTELKL